MIILRAKQVEFDVTYINLRDKPDWFLQISPHGKVPVLKVDEACLFESNAIAEFLEEEVAPKLHPSDPIKRARNRAWTDFVPTFSKAVSGIYYAQDEATLNTMLESAKAPLAKLEQAISDERGNSGPYFNGDNISLVDAAYAPFFQRLSMVEEKLKTGLLDAYPQVKSWARALLDTDAVTGSVHDSFPDEFVANLTRRELFVAPLFQATA